MLVALGISRIDNKSGMTLLEVLVSLGILSVVIAGMTSFMLSSTRETRALTETLAKLDTEKLLIASLADGAACSAELANPALWTAGAQPYNIDTTSPATMLNTSINLPSIHAAASATAPVLVAAGLAPSAMANSLKVNNISVSKFQSTGAPNNYLAELTVSFTGSIRQPSPIKIKKTITTVPNGPNSQKITGCLGSNAAAVGGLIKLADYPAVFGGQKTLDQSFILFGKTGSKHFEVHTDGNVYSVSTFNGLNSNTPISGCSNIFATGSCNSSGGGSLTLTSAGILTFYPGGTNGFMGGGISPPITTLSPWQ